MIPKVSIVIPVYGVEKYIERCVRTLFGQTLDSLEYVFIDDCSPDKSIEIMQKVLDEYPNRKEQVKLIRHEVNQGVGAARNHGVAACTGEYIIHCDPDDWIDLDMYEKMYNKAKETSADMVYCDICCHDFRINDFFINHKEKSSIQEYLVSLLNCESHSGLYNKFVKKNIALNKTLCVPLHICMHEDTLRTIQMVYLAKSIVFLPRVQYHYQCNQTSISHKKWKREHLTGMLEIVAILEKKLQPNKIYKKGIDAFKVEVLRSIVFHPEMSSYEEYKKLRKEFNLIKNLWYIGHSIKIKILMLCSCFSYVFAEKFAHYWNSRNL